MPCSTPAISSAVDGPPAAGCSETLAIRWIGMWPGESANAQPLEPAEALHPGDPPVQLVAGQHAAGDQVPGLGGHPLVVVADGGQAVLAVRSPVTCITGEPYCRRAQLVRGGERGARVGGLVAERPVELGRVPDRLVDGQPQVRRVDDQVVAARLRPRARPAWRPAAPGSCGQLGGEVPAGAGQVLLAAPGRRGERAHGLEPAARARPRPRSRSGCSRTRCWVAVVAPSV